MGVREAFCESSGARMAGVIVGLACALLVSPSDAFAWNPLLLRPERSFRAAEAGGHRGGLGAFSAECFSERAIAGCGDRFPRCSAKSMVEILVMAGTRSAPRGSKARGADTAIQALRLTPDAVVMEHDIKTTRSAKSAPPTGHVVTMGGVAFKVVDLLLLVEGHGGSAAVTEHKLWKSIARDLGVNTKVVHNASTRLRVLHDATVNRLRDTAAALELDSETSDAGEPTLPTKKQGRKKRRVSTMEERAERIEGSVCKQRRPVARKARSVKKPSQKKPVSKESKE